MVVALIILIGMYVHQAMLRTLTQWDSRASDSYRCPAGTTMWNRRKMRPVGRSNQHFEILEKTNPTMNLGNKNDEGNWCLNLVLFIVLVQPMAAGFTTVRRRAKHYLTVIGEKLYSFMDPPPDEDAQPNSATVKIDYASICIDGLEKPIVDAQSTDSIDKGPVIDETRKTKGGKKKDGIHSKAQDYHRQCGATQREQYGSLVQKPILQDGAPLERGSGTSDHMTVLQRYSIR